MLEARLFPFLSRVAADAELRARIAADPRSRAIVERQRAALRAAALDCNACAGATRLSDADIAEGQSLLAGLVARDTALRSRIASSLRASHALIDAEDRSDAELIGVAWARDARTIDRIVDIYGIGAVKAAETDSPAFDVAGKEYAGQLSSVAQLVLERLPGQPAFPDAALAFALRLLRINGRDEAARHEPLALGENRPAIAAIGSIAWKRFPYAVIVVPGKGPDDAGLAISPESRMRAELAVLRWRRGLAPFILVTGGYVHPRLTPFAEAIEMKRVLVREFGVPERAILIDPQARHTTTNLRNAARQIYRYGIPADRPSLITTDRSQSLYIESEDFRERCQRVLGYLPALDLRRVSPVDLAFRPNIRSLEIDTGDPLDP